MKKPQPLLEMTELRFTYQLHFGHYNAGGLYLDPRQHGECSAAHMCFTEETLSDFSEPTEQVERPEPAEPTCPIRFISAD